MRDDELVKTIICVSRMHKRIAEREVESAGIHPSQHHLLMYLSKENQKSQKEIAKDMMVTAATIAVSLKKLQKDGYIEKNTNQDDNRENTIKITQKGRDVIKYSKTCFQHIDESMLAGFDEADRGLLYAYLERMKKNLMKLEMTKGE